MSDVLFSPNIIPPLPLNTSSVFVCFTASYISCTNFQFSSDSFILRNPLVVNFGISECVENVFDITFGVSISIDGFGIVEFSLTQSVITYFLPLINSHPSCNASSVTTPFIIFCHITAIPVFGVNSKSKFGNFVWPPTQSSFK